ncbi:MAG: response regulator [Actinobacteria bacterium]|nr:response regulator [Actinomycetota bacterium]MCL5887277.1 response regulator [Actinomycetota bacterium]
MKAKILVVEDDAQNLYLTRFLLEQDGYEVITAVDGLQAIEAAAQQPDLILMDMLMPRMDGWTATKRIREQYGDDLPIVALTAYSMKGDRESIIEVGCNGYIPKPIDVEDFCNQVEAFL